MNEDTLTELISTPPTELSEPNGACVIYSAARRSCQGWISFLILLYLNHLDHVMVQPTVRKSQKRIVSPPKIISPLGERIKYLPKPVGPCADETFAPKRWSN
jgi:hypothetical protein